jgi:hypothetical protein
MEDPVKAARALVLVAGLCLSRGEPPLEPARPSTRRWLYLLEPLNWQSPPADLELSYQIADAKIVEFAGDGKITVLSGFILRTKGAATMGWCNGCGHVTRAGSWRRVPGDRALEVRTMRIYLQTQAAEPPETATWTTENWTFEGGLTREGPRALRLGQERYVPLENFENPEILDLFFRERGT